jgi:hypothetical protein
MQHTKNPLSLTLKLSKDSRRKGCHLSFPAQPGMVDQSY